MRMEFFDIETDSVDATKIHCIAISSSCEDHVTLYTEEDLDEAIDRLQLADWVCAHNAIGFDVPVLERLTSFKRKGVLDTVVASRLLWPDILGGHSLDAWGDRLGEKKMDFREQSIELGLISSMSNKGDEFLNYTDLMGRYCKQDVVVLKKLYQDKIKPELSSHDWSESMRLEHKMAEIAKQQEDDGWLFDADKAEAILQLVESEVCRIDKELAPIISKNIIDKGEVKRPFKKDGKHSKMAEDWYPDTSCVRGPFSRITFEYPNLGSRQQMIEQLMRNGWEPTNFTEKGNPKLDEESLSTVEGKVGELIALRFKLLKRKGEVSGWLKALRPDGRISAKGIPQGTPTGRWRHSVVVNVSKVNTDNEGHLVYYPSGSIVLGTECRELFHVPDSKVQVGVDASGLELRMLAHYMGDDAFTSEVIDGDVHTKMWKTVDKWVPSRSVQKNVTYCYLYGGGDPKLAETAGHSSPNVGKKIRSNLESGIPALGVLSKRVSRSAKRGYLLGLDRRKIPVRSEHAALNSLLQCAGSVVVKAATTYMVSQIHKHGIRAIMVGNFHDEVQLECHPDDAEIAGKLFIKGLKWAEKHFNLRCPLDGEMKIGRSWAECH